MHLDTVFRCFSRCGLRCVAAAAAALVPLLLLLGGAAGCARTPETATLRGGKDLYVTLTVAGQIRRAGGGGTGAQPPYYYFVLVNLTDEPTDAGPVPVVNSPWGNGFAAPAPIPANGQGFVGFVRYDTFQPFQGYGVYRVARTNPNDPNSPLFNPTLARFEAEGAPDAFTPVTADRPDQIQFRLNLARLPGFFRPGADGVLGTADDTTARYAQINFIATNTLPQNDQNNQTVIKYWDALGDGNTGQINVPLTVSLDQNRVLTNAQSADPEPTGDVREQLAGRVNEPDLDIADWTIEVRSR